MKQRNKVKPIFFLYVSLAVIFGILAGPPDWLQWDSTSYVTAGNQFLSGNLDLFRTPTYPLIIAFFRFIMGYWFSTGVIVFQAILFVYSVYCFSYICSFFIKSRLIYYITVSLFAFHPTMLIWQKMVMSESLSVSLIVIFLYFLMRFIQKQDYKSVILSQILLLSLLFLRPAFIYLLPLNLIFWGYWIYKKRIAHSLVGMLCGIAIIASFGLYCYSFEKQHGIFASSYVSDINQYWILREANLIDLNQIPDENLKKDMTNILSMHHIWYRSDHLPEYQVLQAKHGIAACHEMIMNSIKSNFGKYVKSRIKSFWHEAIVSLGCWEEQRDLMTRLSLFTSINFFQYVTFLVAYGFLFFGYLRKTELAFYSLYLYLAAGAGLFVVIAGAPYSWSRLIVSNIPISFLLFGNGLDFVYNRIKGSK